MFTGISSTTIEERQKNLNGDLSRSQYAGEELGFAYSATASGVRLIWWFDITRDDNQGFTQGRMPSIDHQKWPTFRWRNPLLSC